MPELISLTTRPTVGTKTWRRVWIGLLGTAYLAAPSFAQAEGVVSPNLIVIISDDQRADSIGRLNGGAIQTPHIDRLVDAGFRFTNTYNMGSNSAAVCAPSRAMYLTGRNLAAAWNTTSINGVATIPSHFKAAGYSTFGTGKWHQGQQSFIEGFDAGDNIYFGGCIGCSATSHHLNAGAMNQSYNANLSRLSGGVISNGVTAPGVHVSERFGNATATFISQHVAGTPYLAYVSFTAPHDPRTSPPAFSSLYRDAQGVSTVTLPTNFATTTPIDRSAFDGNIRDEVLLNNIGGHTPSNVREELADYYGMISHMDAQIGHVIDEAMRAEGLDPVLQSIDDLTNTVIVFTSDHGLAIGSHGLLGKQNPYEHSIRAAPMTIAGAVGGIPVPHGSSDALVYLGDLFPTLTHLTGISTPSSVDGESLVDILFGTQTSVRESIYSAYRGLSRAVRLDDWKLMYYPGLHRVQLFDLATDPGESIDLSADVGLWPQMEVLGEEMRQLEAQLNAPGVGSIPEGFFGGLEIAWDAPQDVSSVTDIPPGSKVLALNGGDSAITAGGVQFMPANLGLGESTGVLAGRSTGDAGYDALLDSFTYGGGQSASLELSGLTPGRSYRLQVWYTDLRTTSDGRTMSYTDLGRVAVAGEVMSPALHSVNVVGNLPGVDPPGFMGQFARGIFVAHEPTESLRLATNGFGNAHFNAVLVTESSQVGVRFCSPAIANSSGTPGVIDAVGSPLATINNLMVMASSLPMNSFGFFLTSRSQGFTIGPGGSQGNLCLGGAIGRYIGAGQVQNSGAAGSFSLPLNLAQTPTPTGLVPVQAGETWNFTTWYRDAVGGSTTSNFTDALSISFL